MPPVLISKSRDSLLLAKALRNRTPSKDRVHSAGSLLGYLLVALGIYAVTRPTVPLLLHRFGSTWYPLLNLDAVSPATAYPFGGQKLFPWGIEAG